MVRAQGTGLGRNPRFPHIRAVCQYQHVAGFNAERYLRLTGERSVRDGGSIHGPPCHPALAATAAALVAVDAMTIADARAVIGDYYPAPASAEDGGHLTGRQATRSAASARPGLGPLRVVPCGRVLDQPWGRLTIHYAAFTDHATNLRATLEPGPSQGRRFGPPPDAQRLSVTDAAGTTAIAEFSGTARRGEPAWRGEYEAHPPLATETAWIELLGERVELTAEPAGIGAWAEPMPAQDPAVRHVWERVATFNDFHDPYLALDATITALVAAGALPGDAPVIGAARAVLAMLRPKGAAPAEVPLDLPEPWPALLARWRQTGGPAGTAPVGAITPAFDGITAAVIALDSRDEHFGINVEVVPGVLTGLPYCDVPDQQHLTWWAADDLGYHYLGEQGSWHPGSDRCRGSIGFWPALHPRASRIDLMPTATAARAVIRVPLPWAEHR